MHWYYLLLILVGLILLTRLIQWFAWGRAFSREIVGYVAEYSDDGVNWKKAMGNQSVIPVGQEFSDEPLNTGTTGIVPGGVSWDTAPESRGSKGQAPQSDLGGAEREGERINGFTRFAQANRRHEENSRL